MNYSQLILVDDITEVWPLAMPLINKVLPFQPGYNMADILQALMEERMELWLYSTDGETVEGMIVAYVDNFPRFKVYRIFLMACDKWFKLKYDGQELLDARAKDLGCIGVSAGVRADRSSLLDGLGYEAKYIEHFKDLR